MTTAQPVTAAQPHTAGGEGLTRILEVAEELFSAKGYDAVSIQDIADGARVCKANVFHHFGSKEKLYLSVLSRACHNATQRLDALERPDQPLDPRLKRFATDHLVSLIENQTVVRLILRELLTEGSRQAPVLANQVFGDKFARFVAILRDAQSRGALRSEVDPALAAALLIGANVFYFQAREVLRHFPEFHFATDSARYADAITDLLLHGLVPPAATTDT